MLVVYYRGKTPENAEFAIDDAILDARENRSGASDKAKGRGRGSERKTACPKTRLLCRRPIAISLPVSLVTHSM